MRDVTSLYKLKIGYFADGPWAHQALNKILTDDSLAVAFICARYDRPDLRLQEMAQAHDLPFITHPRINSPEFRDLMLRFDCDIFVSMSFNQIFRKELIHLPNMGTINCHAGKLPFYRGRNILNWVLINDEQEFGITAHYMDEGIDTGDVLVQKNLPISDEDNYRTVLERAYSACAEVLYIAIKQLQAGTAKAWKQSTVDSVGFYCCARQEGDEVLDWKQTSREVFNFVRALCLPGPQARTFLRGQEMRIEKVQLIPKAPNYLGIPGVVVGKNEDSFVVKTADNTIRVIDWDYPSKVRIGDRLTAN